MCVPEMNTLSDYKQLVINRPNFLTQLTLENKSRKSETSEHRQYNIYSSSSCCMLRNSTIINSCAQLRVDLRACAELHAPEREIQLPPIAKTEHLFSNICIETISLH